MKLNVEFVKSSIRSILRDMEAIDAEQDNARERQKAFLEDCKKNSAVQRRIDRARKSIQNKQQEDQE